MRFAISLLLAALLGAGCVSSSPAAEVAPPGATPTADATVTALPFDAEGVVFLPPSQSNERVETLIPFLVNASGMVGEVTARLGARYVAELPASLASVVVEVRDAAGVVIAEATLEGPEREASFALADLAAGEHALALLSYGGSDEEANGDYVAWAIHVGG